MPRLADSVVAEVKGLAARCVVTGTPPVPIIDDWLDRKEMPSGRSESGRQGCVDRARKLVEAHMRIARRQKVLALERARFVVHTECVEADVHSLKINRPPDETAGGNAVDVGHHIEIIGDFRVDAVGRPQLAGSVGGLVIGVL